MSYAEDRLKLGILNVGFVTVAAVVALGLNLTEKVIVFAGSPAQDILALVVVVGLYAAASLPFDIAGGYYLPRKHDREFPSFPSFVLGWLRGVAVQSGAFVVLGSLILGSGRVGGAAGATLAFAAGTLLLLVLRPIVSRLVSPEKRVDADLEEVLDGFDELSVEKPEVTVVSSDEASFTGGTQFGKVLIPERWLEDFDDDVVTAAVARRAAAVESGSATRGVLVAVAWNVVGFGVASVATPGAGFENVASLTNVVLGYTLWSFLGLLVLPTPSRWGVFEADSRALEAGVDDGVLERSIREISSTRAEGEEGSRGVESVFYPIPSIEERTRRLGEGSTTGAWNCARVRLFLSWAGLDFLSRSVHCNVGKPGVWVFLPAD